MTRQKVKKEIYEVMKVFDCTDMPKDVKKIFFDIFELGNDTYVKYTIADNSFSFDEEESKEWSEKSKKIDEWLIKNGAEGPKDKNSVGETVMISYWW